MNKFFGLIDKNGKRVFLGDYILIEDYEMEILDETFRGPEVPFSHVAEVVYDERTFSFGVKIQENGENFCKGFIPFNLILEYQEQFEVIKNRRIK